MLIDAGLEEVQTELLKHCQGLKTEMVSILEAVGRVSAEDLYADCDLPPRQQSAVDGYAVAAENPMEKGKYYIAGHLLL
ncbi:MAG: hypothetical protein PHF24_04075, partial [Syntrophomonas sp.]|nr:hypothetical protein [Syntrophomonas sp.]